MKRLVVIAGVLLSVLIVGVVMVRSDAGTSSGAAAASMPGDANDDIQDSVPAPSAEAAAAAVVAATGEVVSAGLISRRELIESLTTSEFGDTFADLTSQQLTSMKLAMTASGRADAALSAGEFPLRVRTVSRAESTATVEVWSVLVVAFSTQPTARQMWRTVTVELRLVDGIWLVDGWESTDGPTPAGLPDGAISLGGDVADRLQWSEGVVMWPFPNPLDLFGDAIGGVTGWAWDKVVQGIYTWFASGVLVLMEWVWGVLDSATTPRLTDEWFASGLVQPLAAIAVGITVAMMLASAVQAGFGGRPELVVDAFKEGPKAIVASALSVVVMDVLIRGADALSEAVWKVGRADTQAVLDSVANVTSGAGTLAGTFLGPLALLFGMVGLLMTTVVLFMRSALLYLVAAFAPIVWASSVSPVMRGSGRRLVHVTVALVLAKPAITVTLIVGAKLVAHAGAAGVEGEAPDGAAALGTLITGFSCFAIAGLSPWVVYRLLPSVEQASVASGVVGGWGRTGMTAVQAGLMVKSLGASGAASAATRSVPSMSQAGVSGGAPSAGVGSLGGAASPMSGSAATRRPPLPPVTQQPQRRDDNGSNAEGRLPVEAS